MNKQHWGLLLAPFLAVGCAPKQDAPFNAHAPVTLSMDLPESITGGAAVAPSNKAGLAVRASAGTGVPCGYLGAGGDDIMRNGYNMSRFLISTVATWTCIADHAMVVVSLMPHDNGVHATQNVFGSPTYRPAEPTHYRITDDSIDRTSLRLYYGFSQSAPPTTDTRPQFYLHWRAVDEQTATGRLIVDAKAIAPNRKAEDPVAMRMDFNYTSANKLADMYIKFDEGNSWTEGFRIQLAQNPNSRPLEVMYKARAMMALKKQFIDVPNVTEVPKIHIVTVANAVGAGATVARFKDVGIALPVNANLDNDLGDYVFDKDDRYFFTALSSREWVHKRVTHSEFRGGRTTPATGGSWVPLNPSLDMINSALGLPADYFSGKLCANVGDDCNAFLNALHIHAFVDQEGNTGDDPQDWRSASTLTAEYLTSVYPNGQDWTDAFDPTTTQP